MCRLGGLAYIVCDPKLINVAAKLLDTFCDFSVFSLHILVYITSNKTYKLVTICYLTHCYARTASELIGIFRISFARSS